MRARNIEPLGIRITRLRVMDIQGRTLRVFALSGGSVTIGRHPANTLMLNHPQVADCHVRLEHTGDSITVTDLGTRTGTLLHGKRLSPHVPSIWAMQRVLEVGPFRLRLESSLRHGRPLSTPHYVQSATLSNDRQLESIPAPSLYVDVAINDDRAYQTLVVGQRTLFHIFFHNRSDVDEHLDLGIVGIPSAWYQLPEQPVHVGSGKQGVSVLAVTVPEVFAALAGMYAVLIVARSHHTEADVGSTLAHWNIRVCSEGTT